MTGLAGTPRPRRRRPGLRTGGRGRAAFSGSSLLPGRAGRPLVGLPNGVDQLGLGHPRSAAYLEPSGQVHQVALLRGVGVDPSGRAATAPCRPPGPRGLGVRGPLAALRLPVVADLLEAVLERGKGGPVRALTLAVLLDRGVVRLDPGALRLRRRALQRRGKLLPGRYRCTSSPGGLQQSPRCRYPPRAVVMSSAGSAACVLGARAEV